MTFSRPSFRGGLLTAVGTLLALALWAPNAFASCNYPTAKQSFAPWHDSALYVSPFNGGLESGSTGWSLSGAKVVSGNESFHLNGYSDSHSLLIPYGASATSPAFCVAHGYPTFRFMIRNAGAQRYASLRVDVLYADSLGRRQVKSAGYLTAGQAWEPSRKLSLALGSTGAMQVGPANVQIRFVPVNSGGAYQIDDLLVDPWRRA
jgi:hypothetical protein